ncbi:DUF664 domain-containing protein [Lentzea tibetensis]|uniref:DUF664 domain-containing protein n=1 Tax=Lentzea tibetensis TaxID=2591470 RepID=A0A563EQY3_9PSEU|nr:DUF664 domain-containing protein [Lentzea tibetensis]TWP49966.1 DUF664 domain-containing protein [Lentzea tibetensis]
MPTLVRDVVDEKDALLAFLTEQRGALRRSVLGLTDAQALEKPGVSALTLAALLRHAAIVERNWTGILIGKPSEGVSGFDVPEGATVADLLADLAAAAAETEAAVAGVDLSAPVDIGHGVVPAGTFRSGRWIVLHLIEEFARHAGHADIIRESLDGADAVRLVLQSGDWPELPDLLRRAGYSI